MPFRSQAQKGYFFSHKSQLEKEGVDVDEWARASKGKSLPKRVGAGARNAQVNNLKSQVKSMSGTGKDAGSAY